ncbi:MAG TPA: 50S ribosomal protein L18, partial [Dehalococcoidales bacterium]|nr:50S ribosomal protein L18 [Dehalococcoidales bacterium]
MKTNTTRLARIRRHERVRSKIEGTTERPRLSVFRSLNHIYAQVIDDVKGTTLASASTLDPEITGNLESKNK